MPIRVADYIFRTLADHGARHVFLVTGGGAMHLNDALGRESRLTYVCNHHEQASAIAAEGYARITGNLGVACVTSGPGGINALNGVFGAFTDSIPIIVVSGQMKRETLLRTHGLTGRLRQLGDQEVDIIRMAESVTKYAACITEPDTIRYHLGRALHLALAGRPGPVWIDVPVDVQAALIEPDTLRAYDPAEDDVVLDEALLRDQAADVAARLLSSARPVLLGGTGVRLAGAIPEFLALAERLQIPVTTAWTHDLIASDHPLFCGRQGTIGTRAGNFVVQNSDLLLILGSRLCIRQISYNWQSFARHAHTVQVDIDPAELDKPTFRATQPVHADARQFLRLVLEALGPAAKPSAPQLEWRDWACARRRLLPEVLPRHRVAAQGTINQYHFVELLFAASAPGDIFACGDATACITPFQAGALKEGQRLFSNSGSASMGYDLPAALGAAFAAPDRRVICIGGDGSAQMNIQELATIAHHRPELKIFILNNDGYLSIRSTQANFFKLLVGEGPQSGVTFPDYAALSRAYGLPSTTLDVSRPAAHLAEILARPGPELIVVELDRSQSFEPKLSSKRLPDGRMVTAPLEDMAPFLDREEFARHMLVPIQPE
jgi:acetolactate synthase I/II/III large subunit